MARCHHAIRDFGLALIGLSLISADASASDATTQARRTAYEFAMTCYVAYGTARGNALDVGRKPEAATYEARSRKAFNMAVNLGNALGYSGTHENEDFGLAEARELPKFVKDRAYLNQTLTACQSAGVL